MQAPFALIVMLCGLWSEPADGLDWLLAAGSQTWCAVALYLATGRILLQRAGLAEESARVPNAILSPEWAARLRAA
jgi:hypothetical protein